MESGGPEISLAGNHPVKNQTSLADPRSPTTIPHLALVPPGEKSGPVKGALTASVARKLQLKGPSGLLHFRRAEAETGPVSRGLLIQAASGRPFQRTLFETRFFT
jgi:hypothetical protein